MVTGAASGIGATTARILRERGDHVIGIDLRDVDVEADLSTPAGRATAARTATELAGGTIDTVIACAGLAAPVPLSFAVNYFGVVHTLTDLLPALSRSQAPRAAVVSSMATLQPVSIPLVAAALADDEHAALAVAVDLAAQGPESAGTIYPSSKRALSRWVRRESISPEWAGAGIPLNAVAPGTVVTPMTTALLADPEQAAVVDASVPMPLGYHQPPESVANLLVWLTSVENTHLAGQTIYVDGGADATLRGDDIWSWNDPARPAA